MGWFSVITAQINIDLLEHVFHIRWVAFIGTDADVDKKVIVIVDVGKVAIAIINKEVIAEDIIK